MAQEEAISLEDWCSNHNYNKYLEKLKDMDFESINDVCVLNENDLNEVCGELGLKFGKKSKFLQAIKAAKRNIEEKDSGISNVSSVSQFVQSKGINQVFKRKQVSLIFLGETGVGKSTLLESLGDYINGRTYEDIKTTDGSNESVTQTSNQFELCNNKWAVNIIDTPGIGDTRGVDQDEKNMDNITDFLGNYGEFNAICILIKRGSSRLTERFEYIINEIRANLPKSVNNNFITIMTRADVALPDEGTKKAIISLGLPTNNIVPINNVAYEEIDISDYSLDSPIVKASKAKAKLDYYANQEYLEILLEVASKMKPHRGDKIRELKIKRDKLKEEVALLQLKIQDSFQLDEDLNDQLIQLKNAELNKTKYADFKKLHQWQEFDYIKQSGKVSTHCNSCQKVCHIDCSLSYGDDLSMCCCSGSNGCCVECGHSMTSHTHLGWKKIVHHKSGYKEDPQAKLQWENATQRAKMIKKRQKEIDIQKTQNEQDRDKQANKITQLYKELSNMAIIGHNFSAEKYMKECRAAIEAKSLTKQEKDRRLGLIDSMMEKLTVLKNVIVNSVN